MIEAVGRDGVQRLVREEGAQVVEVLPRPEYEWAHLPGALHLPLKELTAQSAAVLDRDRPVIVYCSNTECDMSPRAAVRLRRLGFGRLHHYGPGKLDWLSFGLPYAGSAVLAGDLIRRDVPTCRIEDRLAEVRGATFGEGELCVVLDDDRVVQGVLRNEALRRGDEAATAEQAMTFGISTVRPSEDAEKLTGRMRRRHVDTIPVTSSDGRLLGILVRAEAEAALRERQYREPAPGQGQKVSTS